MQIRYIIYIAMRPSFFSNTSITLLLTEFVRLSMYTVNNLLEIHLGLFPYYSSPFQTTSLFRVTTCPLSSFKFLVILAHAHVRVGLN